MGIKVIRGKNYGSHNLCWEMNRTPPRLRIFRERKHLFRPSRLISFESSYYNKRFTVSELVGMGDSRNYSKMLIDAFNSRRISLKTLAGILKNPRVSEKKRQAVVFDFQMFKVPYLLSLHEYMGNYGENTISIAEKLEIRSAGISKLIEKCVSNGLFQFKEFILRLYQLVSAPQFSIIEDQRNREIAQRILKILFVVHTATSEPTRANEKTIKDILTLLEKINANKHDNHKIRFMADSLMPSYLVVYNSGYVQITDYADETVEKIDQRRIENYERIKKVLTRIGFGRIKLEESTCHFPGTRRLSVISRGLVLSILRHPIDTQSSDAKENESIASPSNISEQLERIVEQVGQSGLVLVVNPNGLGPGGHVNLKPGESLNFLFSLRKPRG
ncbi:MAG: hypothetical protein FD145_1413 [Candidatus Saganbacteria bacterium]|uniref:Uncharacterized protein n=1 Tax=Candidatus Saganbacteria bacterium TaxID=2575572 RepID=A0A833KZW8_UNCSA|nr:MAG: hypothetical protein FD145_1413 [Candidatus Saganbacteria bacterium]